jgi:hypothetical protein
VTVFSPTAAPHQLAGLRRDLDQLRLPIPRPLVRQRVRVGSRRVTQWRDLGALPPLLVQLRSAVDRQMVVRVREEARRPAGSREPGNIEAVDLLARVYVGISGWHAGLGLSAPPRPPVGPVDWQLYALGQLHDVARRLAPETVEAVAADAHRWWRWAASAAGFSTAELIELRGGV